MADGNEIIPINTPAALLMSTDTVDVNYFMEHWEELLQVYIGHGRPSKDTWKNCRSHVGQFIRWCLANNRHPLAIHDFQMRIYLKYLYDRNYKQDTVAIKINHIRAFFGAACKLGVIASNPCRDIRVPMTVPEDMLKFFTPDQLYEIRQAFDDDNVELRRKRNVAILYLMSVEGLRNVEIHRMNREDVDWHECIIRVHGKGHDRNAFPCEETMEMMAGYYRACPEDIKKDSYGGIPFFLSDSNFNLNGRISRNGIRWVMNQALEKSGYKMEGLSCHIMRHSAGTNLYAATKDLRLVQETLGHRDPKVTARYAHLQERMSRRRTAAIVPRPANTTEKG